MAMASRKDEIARRGPGPVTVDPEPLEDEVPVGLARQGLVLVALALPLCLERVLVADLGGARHDERPVLGLQRQEVSPLVPGALDGVDERELALRALEDPVGAAALAPLRVDI